jgi:hypothetical protein
MATTKKPTTAKKPAAKKTAVIKAHRGMAHVPRNPRRRPPNLQVEPRRLGDGRPQMPRGRNPRLPANFFQMSPNARKQFLAVRAAKDATRRRFNQRRGQPQPFTPAMRDLARRQSEAARKRMQQMTPAQREAKRKQLEAAARKQLDRPTLPIRRRPTVEQLRNAKRRRRPVGDPKPRRRVTPTQRSRDRNQNTSDSPRAGNPNTGGGRSI